MKTLLVTGSSSLIGSQVVESFSHDGWQVHGVDNSLRANFFGPGGDTRWNQQRLLGSLKHFSHHELDKLKAHYPGWGITKDLPTTFVEIHEAWVKRKS